MLTDGRIQRSASITASMLRVDMVLKESILMPHTIRLHAMAFAATIVLLIASIGVSQAQARVTVKAAPSGKVSVPANIISGSALTKGRVFYRPNLYESTLAGIRLGRPANEVLAKWGNPTRITLGSVQGEAPAQQAAPGIPYMAPGGSPFGEPTLSGGLTGLPGLPGLQVPGMPGGQQQAGPGTESASLRQDEVTWTYDLHNGITLEFIITEGTITQITVGGVGPWSLSKTRTGLQLGDTYKLVLWVCGYPESQKFVGRFLRVSYVEKSRVLFTFLDKKVVGITIALVPQEIAGK